MIWWTNVINGALLLIILGVALYEFCTHHDTTALRTHAARSMARADALDAMRSQRDESELRYASQLGLKPEHVANRVFRNAPQKQEAANA